MWGQEASPGQLRRVSSTIITLSPAGQRQVQNGPSTDDVEGQRRQVMEQQQQQQQMQAQMERERRTSASVSTLQFKVSPSPCQSEYRPCRASTLPPASYTKVTSPPLSSCSSSSSSQDQEGGCDSPHCQAQRSQLSTSLASAFSPVQPGGGAQSRKVRQIPLSPPMPPRSSTLPPKPGVWSSPLVFTPLPSSPPVAMAVPVRQVCPQPVLPVALPLPPLQNGRGKASPADRAPLQPSNGLPEECYASQPQAALTGPAPRPAPSPASCTLLLKNPDGTFAPCCEAVPLPALIGHRVQGPTHQLPFPSFQGQQLYQIVPPLSSSAPSYTALSEGASPEKTPTPTSQATPNSSAAVPPGHPSVLSVAPPIATPAPVSAGGPPPPPPPPGPPPPSTGAPPPPPPLPAGGGPGGQGEEAPSGLAAALAGAKLRRVQRPEDGGSSGAKSDANRTSGGAGGGGGLMEEMNALLARRRKAATQTEKPGDKKEEESQNEDPNSPITRAPGQANSTDPVKKPWDRANSADKSSLVSRVRPIGSTSDTDALDFDRMKQEILEEVVRELHKVKDEIIDAIRHELSRISTT
ncbi:enah/Vasp-like a isoform X2 [Megalops cyprinoides]|uniref:enah/Vasp-like a isoform X2 n=1 Tax=Megalops cyprinoides TaxID=118141 RepID=UPI001864C9D6|nr:enah/Vasp-like a isoform X2 [Megalops cyprinoides]